jgi:hypothetical protein
MRVLAQSVWVIWIGSLAAIFFGGGWIAAVGAGAFALTLAVHAVEFAVNLPLFRRAGGSMTRHCVQTLIYGLFYWRPIQERLGA